MTEADFLKAVEDATQKTSVECLESFAQLQEVKLVSANPTFEKLCKNSLVLIIVSGAGIHQTFKMFFNPQDTKSLITNIYKDSVTPDNLFDRSTDFFKEVSNLVAGHLKKLYAQSEIETDISLPILLRGYDSLFFDNQANSIGFEASWELNFKNIPIICSTQFQLKEFKEGFEFEYFGVGGDIEFF